MTTRDEVSTFVREALARGGDRATIAADLTAAGWSKRDAARALAAWGDTSSGVPVPRPRPYVSAREAFVFGLMFLALVVTCVSLAQLAFALIDRLVPDPVADRYDYGASGIRWSMAMLVVFFPAFAALAWRAETGRRRDPDARPSLVRKWLGYLGLFAASVALLGTAVGTIYGLLDGSLTLRFILKSVTVAAIAACVFAFFHRDTTEDRDDP